MRFLYLRDSRTIVSSTIFTITNSVDDTYTISRHVLRKSGKKNTFTVWLETRRGYVTLGGRRQTKANDGKIRSFDSDVLYNLFFTFIPETHYEMTNPNDPSDYD